MKTRISTKAQGGTLVVCILTTAILGMILATYLDLTVAQTQSTMRSLTWNSTLPILEAGVEEALSHLYFNDTNLASNGWTFYNSNYVRWRAIGDGKTYVVISNATKKPVVFAEGYAQVPRTGQWVSRLVRVETRKDGLFSKGIVAKGQITFNGNNVLVDSFDSTDPAFSTNGLYTASKRKDHGDVATNASLTNVLSGGNADIYGNIATGPGGSANVGANGAVGDLAWIDGGNSGIKPGYFSSDMNISIPDVPLPFTGGSFTPVGGAGYQYILPDSSNYEITTLTGSLLVKSNANAVLLVNGDIHLTGQDAITIEPGGSLRLYVRGASAKIGGNGVVNNGGRATNFYFFGLPSNQELTISGNGTFTGVIYAPGAAFTLNGGGSSTEDVVGSAVAASVTINGQFGFHYDESLAYSPYRRGYIITSWNEL